MSDTQFKKNADDEVAICGPLNFDNVSDLHRQGLVFLSQAKVLSINLEGVTYSDSSGMALLIGWLRYAKQHHITIYFINTPLFMVDFAVVTGVDKLMPWCAPTA